MITTSVAQSHQHTVPTATETQAREGVATDVAMTPANVRQALDANIDQTAPSIRPNMFGAELDGINDDSAAFALCIARAKATGQAIVILPGETLLNSLTHFIDYDGFHITGGGEIAHNLNDGPIFVLGSNSVRVSDPTVIGIKMRQVCPPVDLHGTGDSVFTGTSKQQWFSAIYARNTKGAQIRDNVCQDFFKLVFFDGKHTELTAQGPIVVERWHEDIVVDGNTAIDCTYLMTGNLMDGWHVTNNTMRGFQRLNTDDGKFAKKPHLLYKVDRSVGNARHFTVTGNVAINCTEGPAYVFRGVERGVVSGNTSYGEGAIFADSCNYVEFSDHIHRAVNETDDEFMSGIEARGCKRCIFTDMIIDMRGAWGYGLRAVSAGSDNPVERYGEHNVFRNITFMLDDAGRIDRPVLDIQAERDSIFENLKWTYDGNYGVYPIRMNVSSIDAALKNQRIKIINPQVTKATEAGGVHAHVLHVTAGSTDSATLIINTDLLNFDWASSSLLDPDVVCKLVKNGQMSGTWTPKLLGLTTEGSNAYTAAVGEWARTGDIVLVRCRVTLNGALTSTGTIRVGGAPFNVKSSPSVNFSGLAHRHSLITIPSGAILQMSAVVGTKQIALQSLSNTGASTLTHSAFAANASIEFALTYQTSDAF